MSDLDISGRTILQGGGGTAGAGADDPANAVPAARRWASRVVADAQPSESTRRMARVDAVDVTVTLPLPLVETFQAYVEDASVAAGDRIAPADVLAGMLIRFMRDTRNDLAEEQRLEALFADWLSGEIDVTRTRRHLLNPKAAR